MKVAFFGNTKYSVIDARVLHERFGLVLVVTKPDKPSGRKRVLTANPVKTFAVANKIPVIEVDSFQTKKGRSFTQNTPGRRTDLDLIDQIKAFEPDFIVVADYGVILPKDALEIPKIAPLNVHQSLLPKYRGTSPAPAAILAGDKKTGVTIIKMAEEVDSGDIMAQEEYEMEQTETTDSLLIKLNQLGSQLVCKVIENYDNLTPKPQNESKATLTQRMSKQDGFIDLENPPDTVKLDRMIRAYFPWPGVWAEIELRSMNNELRKIKLKFLPNSSPIIHNSKFMILPEGKRPMTPKEFLNGYPQAKPLLEKLLTP